MKREHIFLIFTLFLTFLCFYFLYQILSPFLVSIFWAILLATVSYPVFQKLQRLLKKRKVLAAMIMTLLVILVIVLPSSLLSFSLANELVGVYHELEEMIQTGRLETHLEQIREITIFNWIWRDCINILISRKWTLYPYY